MRSLVLVAAILMLTHTAYAHDKSALLKKAADGNLRALEQAFSLYVKSDGGAAEDLAVAIGKSIRLHPKNFLIALKQNRGHAASLGPVDQLGSDFVDHVKEQESELKARLTAIQSVKADSLADVRRDCEAELKRRLDSLKSAE